MSFKSNSSISLKQLSKSKETLSTKVSSTESPQREIFFEHNAFFLSKLQAFDTKFAESEVESEYEDEEYDDKSFPQGVLRSPKLHSKEHEINIDPISTLSI